MSIELAPPLARSRYMFSGMFASRPKISPLLPPPVVLERGGRLTHGSDTTQATAEPEGDGGGVGEKSGRAIESRSSSGLKCVD